MTLFVDLDLPPGALLDRPPVPLAPALEALGAIWLDFDPDCAIREGATITALTPRTGDTRAEAVEANEGDATLASYGDTHVLMTEARRNAGFALPEMPVGRVSLVAVLAATTGAERTIAGLEAPGSGRNFHLSVEEGAVVFGERRAERVAHLPLPIRATPVLILASLGPDDTAVAVDHGAPVVAPLDSAWIAETLRPLIACRRLKPGLTNTLGEMKLSDIMILPGQDIFDAGLADLRAALLTHAQGTP